jgi:hypothetical protein
MWRRADGTAVTVDGDAAVAARLRRVLREGTQ